jgi:hypothetical protein
MKDATMTDFKNSEYWKRINTKAPAFRVTELDESKIQGYADSTPKKKKKGTGVETITIPSDPNQLREELVKQLSACRSGNNNTFNYTNALMKEMLNQKLITGKDYRSILKTYFHV